MTVLDLLSHIGIGGVVFASTNVDDIVLLSMFFTDPHVRPRAVVLGQYLGIGALVLGSAVCAFVALAIPEGWIAVLGVVPLALGLHKLWAARGSADEENEEARGLSTAGRRSHAQIAAVALVTMANGGDNLGVYVPLFARNLAWVPLYVAVFFMLTGAWCWVGYRLVHHPVTGGTIRRYGRRVLPFVLMALGLYVLSGLAVLWD